MSLDAMSFPVDLSFVSLTLLFVIIVIIIIKSTSSICQVNFLFILLPIYKNIYLKMKIFCTYIIVIPYIIVKLG